MRSHFLLTTAAVLATAMISAAAKTPSPDKSVVFKETISPYHNISKDTPPTVVNLGKKDSLIKPKVAEDFQKKMKDLGLRSDLHLYDGQRHGFFNQGKAGGYFEITIEETDRFLSSLGYLAKRAQPDAPSEK